MLPYKISVVAPQIISLCQGRSSPRIYHPMRSPHLCFLSLITHSLSRSIFRRERLNHLTVICSASFRFFPQTASRLLNIFCSVLKLFSKPKAPVVLRAPQSMTLNLCLLQPHCSLPVLPMGAPVFGVVGWRHDDRGPLSSPNTHLLTHHSSFEFFSEDSSSKAN